MQKVQAPTLQEAYEKAAKVLECSVTDLQTEVIQHPSSGLLGLFKKEAIIVAVCKSSIKPAVKPCIEIEEDEEPVESAKAAEEVAEYIDAHDTDDEAYEHTLVEESEIVEEFFSSDNDNDEEDDEDDDEVVEEASVVYSELAQLIEKELKGLMDVSCFDIDVVEVDVRDDTALIFIDGEDAALLIGKEGYRYNAFSYMLFNWLHTKYELFIKLEIAAFLTSQQEMIRNSMEEVIEHVNTHGKGRTRFLDGILVQIALEYLREVFPDKYVAVKTSKNGKKFIVINAFNKK